MKAHVIPESLIVFGERLLGHTAALFVGFALMVLGLGLGVTMVLLPVGLVVGIAGVLLFLYGLFGTSA